MIDETLAERLRQAELKLAGIAQRVDDHENDYRVFAPLVTEQALQRQFLEKVAGDVKGAHDAIRDLGVKLEHESHERITGQQARKAELEAAIEERNKEMAHIELEREKQHRELRVKLLQATLALIGVFLTSGGAVLVAILSQGGH